MKIDKAIQYVKLERDYLAKKNEPASIKLRAKIVMALDVALGSMDKRKPQKVKAEKYMYGKLYHCPVCNIFVGYKDDLSLPKYCKCCGQALSYDEVQEDEK